MDDNVVRLPMPRRTDAIALAPNLAKAMADRLAAQPHRPRMVRSISAWMDVRLTATQTKDAAEFLDAIFAEFPGATYAEILWALDGPIGSLTAADEIHSQDGAAR